MPEVLFATSNDEFGQNSFAQREAKKWLISSLRLLGVAHGLRLVGKPRNHLIFWLLKVVLILFRDPGENV